MPIQLPTRLYKINLIRRSQAIVEGAKRLVKGFRTHYTCGNAMRHSDRRLIRVLFRMFVLFRMIYLVLAVFSYCGCTVE